MISRAVFIASSMYQTYSSLVTLPSGLTLTGTTSPLEEITGDNEGLFVDSYRGIPFADPPVGSLRFAPPVAYSGTWDHAHLFDSNPSGCTAGYVFFPELKEDCLYLSLYRPSSPRTGSKLPVLVWIHGGSFLEGGIGRDASILSARENVIIVQIAYRLGAFGFFASDSTFVESGTTGNWALMDQQLGLRWVQDNIASFGGDPHNVLLSGFSAGAMSVFAHLVSPMSRGLFSSAMALSGSSSGSQFFQPKEDSSKFYNWLVSEHTSCGSAENQLECVRSLPVEAFELLPRETKEAHWASRFFPYMSWGFTVDNVLLQGTPLAMAQQGLAMDVPVVIGFTQDDAMPWVSQIFERLNSRPDGVSRFDPGMTKLIGDHFLGDPEFVDSVLQDLPLYRKAGKDILPRITAAAAGDISPSPSDPPSAFLDELASFLLLSESARASFFVCPSFAFADALSSRNKSPVYVYNFAHVTDQDKLGPGPWNVPEWGLRERVPHGHDVRYIFQDTRRRWERDGKWFDRNRGVGDTMGCFVGNFAKCGQTECEGRVCTAGGWKRWGSEREFMHVENAAFRMEKMQEKGRTAVGAPLPSAEQCQAWNNVKTSFLDFRIAGNFRTQLDKAMERNGASAAV